MAIEVTVPDIGDFDDVPVISILVSVGDVIAEEDPLVELESDKATMEVPSSAAGKVTEIKVSEGDKVSKGDLLLLVEGDGASAAPKEEPKEDKPASAPAAPAADTTVSFDNCIIAAGSEPVELPFIPHEDPRVMDSTGALELADIPNRMLVLGGGIIGLEMACVYDALGSKITVVEFMDQLMPGADKDMVRPLQKRVEGRYEKIMLKTKVTAMEAQKKGLKVTFEDDKGEITTDTFDRVLVSVGRRPNGKLINAEAAGVAVDERGFIAVDHQQRTGQSHIFAIGDVVGQPMLAHKAVHEGKVAAEVAAGHKRAFDAQVIPSVAYTDPEVAWVGLTETQAKEKGIKVEKGVFPWAASGRSLSNGRSEGMTKLLFNPEDDRIVGAAIVGTNAGDLIAEAALAIEMGADAVDLGHTIHPHPTLSETINFAAEMFEGTITDLMPPKKRK
ncbi:UNVERIFIED_CONTAM: hypothetical protein GTU68_015549 [Idotea baltica]|nr:hypothetical protein [Idotea baltica]